MKPIKIKITVCGLAIMTGMILLVIVGGCVTNEKNFENTTPSVTSLPLTSVLPTSSLLNQAAYCFVQEVQPGFIQNETIVQITSEDLRDFPPYEEAIKRGRNNTQKWYNGYRFVGDFTGTYQEFEAFRNLSCKHSPDPSCGPWDFAPVFEHEGRYYQVGCLPGFGANTPPPLLS